MNKRTRESLTYAAAGWLLFTAIVATEVEAPPTTTTQIEHVDHEVTRMQGLASAVLRRHEQAPGYLQFEGKPPQSVGSELVRDDGSHVFMEVQSSVLLPNGDPDPKHANYIGAAVVEDDKTTRIELRLLRTGEWNGYWSQQRLNKGPARRVSVVYLDGGPALFVNEQEYPTTTRQADEIVAAMSDQISQLAYATSGEAPNLPPPMR